MSDRTCPVCNEVIAPEPVRRGRKRKYCSAKCGRWFENHMGSRTCSMSGCTNPHRARGLCSTHYNERHHPDRHRKPVVACSACGAQTEKTGGGARRPVCSYRCRYFVQHGKWPSSKELVGPIHAAAPIRITVAPLNELPSLGRVFVAGRCPQCGDRFTRWTFSDLPSTCSRRCSGRVKKQKFYVARTVRQAIYERDGWICQLCDEPVDRAAHYMDDWAPSLDRIVPQSLSDIPDHSPKNLRTAHRWCNSVRGNGQNVPLIPEWPQPELSPDPLRYLGVVLG